MKVAGAAVGSRKAAWDTHCWEEGGLLMRTVLGGRGQAAIRPGGRNTTECFLRVPIA